jgi:broad specificity phosphatase PhoE
LVASTRLTWICHAATAATRRAAFPADEPIEEKGAPPTLRLDRQDAVFAGPELRVRQTVEALGLEASIEPALRDCDYGRWSGRPLAELETAEPAALAAWLADPTAAPHGGESFDDLTQRIGAWLDSPTRPTGRVVAVTHPAVIRCGILHALAAPVSSFWRIDVPPLSRTLMLHDGRTWKLRALP